MRSQDQPAEPGNHHQVSVIGSGPAGLTAAIYAARANLGPLVVEGEVSSTSDQPGGRLMLTTEVENFPGFPDGIDGPKLMGQMRLQAERFGSVFLTEKVTSIDFEVRPFQVMGAARRTQLTRHRLDRRAKPDARVACREASAQSWCVDMCDM